MQSYRCGVSSRVSYQVTAQGTGYSKIHTHTHRRLSTNPTYVCLVQEENDYNKRCGCCLPGSDEIYFLFHQELCEIVEQKLWIQPKTYNDSERKEIPSRCERMIDGQIEVKTVCGMYYREGFGWVLIFFAWDDFCVPPGLSQTLDGWRLHKHHVGLKLGRAKMF